MSGKRSLLLLATILMGLSLLAAACGSTSNTASDTGAEGGGNSAAPANADNAPADQTAAPAEAKLRSFDTVKGAVNIPEKPLRIVTDYYGGELLSLGGNVVGFEPTAFNNPFLKGLTDNTASIGEPIDSEKVLGLAPDLIVLMYDTKYEELSKIAPTIHIPFGTATNFQETVKLFGDIVGAPEKADELLAAFDQKAAEGREKLKGIVDPNATVGLYELTDKGDLWIFGDNAGRGGQAVYNALQLKMPHKGNADEQTKQLSMEVLPEYAGDYMFLTTYDPEKKGDQLQKLKESPVWRNLPAAKNNQLFYNDYETFYRYDPLAILGQIDLVVDMLLERSEANKQG